MLVSDLFENEPSIDTVVQDVYQTFTSSPEAKRVYSDDKRIDGHTVEIRHWGKWMVPQDEEDDGDYDWTVPTKETGDRAVALLTGLRSKYPFYNINMSFEEKEWIFIIVS